MRLPHAAPKLGCNYNSTILGVGIGIIALLGILGSTVFKNETISSQIFQGKTRTSSGESSLNLSGETIGMRIPGVNLPCLCGLASAIQEIKSVPTEQ